MNGFTVQSERWTYFLLGVIMALAMILMTGAAGQQYGRYQVASWATSFGDNSGGCGAFIVDTATGTTKSAYTVIYGNPQAPSVLKNNLRKPFPSIK